jgi:hypothetical protein
MWDHPKHHDVNVPCIPPSQPASVTGGDPDPENRRTSLAAHQQALHHRGSGHAATPQQAVALSWIFCEIGDVHQPPHTTALFTTNYPPPGFCQLSR